MHAQERGGDTGAQRRLDQEGVMGSRALGLAVYVEH